MSQEPEASSPCPRCQSANPLIDDETRSGHQTCPTCEGTYLQTDAATRLVEGQLGLDRSLLQELGAHFGGKQLVCPGCGAGMSAISLRGVWVDLCLHCRGLWLDRDELAQLKGEKAPARPSGSKSGGASTSPASERAPRLGPPIIKAPNHTTPLPFYVLFVLLFMSCGFLVIAWPFGLVCLALFPLFKLLKPRHLTVRRIRNQVSWRKFKATVGCGAIWIREVYVPSSGSVGSSRGSSAGMSYSLLYSRRDLDDPPKPPAESDTTRIYSSGMFLQVRSLAEGLCRSGGYPLVFEPIKGPPEVRQPHQLNMPLVERLKDSGANLESQTRPEKLSRSIDVGGTRDLELGISHAARKRMLMTAGAVFATLCLAGYSFFLVFAGPVDRLADRLAPGVLLLVLAVVLVGYGGWADSFKVTSRGLERTRQVLWLLSRKQLFPSAKIENVVVLKFVNRGWFKDSRSLKDAVVCVVCDDRFHEIIDLRDRDEADYLRWAIYRALVGKDPVPA